MTHSDAFVKRYPIRFSHCDPAGIVFFPQYLVLFNQLVEDWFNEALQVPYADLIGRQRFGIPIVRLECDFRAISRMGEELDFSLVPLRIGKKSLSLNFAAHHGQELRVESKQTLVFTHLDDHRSIALPAEIRSRLVRLYGESKDDNN